MNRWVSEVLRKLTEKGDISEDENELYEYAIMCLFSICAPFVIAFLIGLLMGKVIESVIFIIPFVLIRKFAGGYHAKNALLCMIESIIVLYVFIYLSGIIHYRIALLLGILSTLELGCFSPIDSDNRRLDDNEKKICKRITLIILALSWGIIIVSMCHRFDYTSYFSMSLVLMSCLQVLAVCKRLLKLHS